MGVGVPPTSLPSLAWDQSEIMFMSLIIPSTELKGVMTALRGLGSNLLRPLALRMKSQHATKYSFFWPLAKRLFWIKYAHQCSQESGLEMQLLKHDLFQFLL